MSFEQALDFSLADALGHDLDLVAELRGVFLDSAVGHLDAMRAAESDSAWRDSALRLKGLAASFGATSLMEQAGRAADTRRGDAQAIGHIERGLVVLSF